MTPTTPVTIPTEELRERLEAVMGCTILDLRRQPSPYRSTFPLEELRIRIDDGLHVELMLKDVGPQSNPIKPGFVYDPQREIAVYTRVLAEARLGTARCYAGVADAAQARYWLVLEKVPGVELYQVGDLTVWQAAARWLAQLHGRELPPGDVPLLRHTSSFYTEFMRRALAQARGRGPADALAWLAERHEAVAHRLLNLPCTFIHGEFYASNVLVHTLPDVSVRICPIDWEMAAVGPGLMDLAALTAGLWSADARRALAEAYLDTNGFRGTEDDFWIALDCCRLQLAVQWLGWSPGWQAPEPHRHDWLAEALSAAERLGL